MMDLPQEPAVVHEVVVDTKDVASLKKDLEITDLSFYDVLMGGLCSGNASSGAAEKIIASVAPTKEA